MTSLLLLKVDSVIGNIDPRARLVAGFLFSVLLAVAQKWEVIAAGFLSAFLFCAAARLPWSGLRVRLIGLNVFMLALLLVMPWSVPGSVLWNIGNWTYTIEGVELALMVAVKGNAIVLAMSVFISTIDTASLGHALEHLRAPRRLVHLFLFTVRYLDILHHESRRLFRAARARGFAPRTDLHTYRTVSRLIGTIMVRSLDRSERVLAAMKARGYCGRFYLFHHFSLRTSDALFIMTVSVFVAVLAWMEWG